jgi:hypothetical protein
MNLLSNALQFLSLVNDDGNLSVTTLGVYVVLVKLALTPSWDLTQAGVLLVTLANYAHKRHVLSGQEPEQQPVDLQPLQDQLSKLQDRVGAMSLAQGIKAVGREGKA